ncbi:hypothetical protein [Natronosalvus halobius]|uniref:hypothetical protein n=1 Tax=Natronosalvus halobius TaxID=2953746 RepID=UPI0020A1297F|nr:hypothetical protein [Natronosalvus halobius]USZ70570.1 hypothetical protein NGM15_10670 [Natronosalvus halobius]
MSSDDSRPQNRRRRTSRRAGTGSGPSTDDRPRMLARTWVLAARFGDPADYDVPTVPAWTVLEPESGGIAFAADGAEPFIHAERPATVRR